MLCQKILKIKFPRLAKNAFVIQHLLHHSIAYIFIHYNCTINYYKMNHFALKLFQQLVKILLLVLSTDRQVVILKCLKIN